MNNLIFALAALSLIATQTMPLSAEAAANQRIKRTQVRQNARIHHGVKSGEITRTERKELKQDQRELNKARKEAKRDDGVLDREERKELRKDQVEASKNIYQQKHDDESRDSQ